MFRSRLLPWVTISVLIGVIGLTFVTCSGDDAGPEVNNPSPTPPEDKLEVVVFETEAPTNTPIAESPSESEATATPAATVGGGATTAEGTPAVAEDAPQESDDVALVTSNSGAGSRTNADFSRPPDINPLTGRQVADPAVLNRRPLLVRVGNDLAARPQVGLNQADLVYEEITEWWVTRFTAIYLSQDPEMIAPIRSARLINLQLIPQYQGVLANSGASDGVRWELSQSSIINMDEFFVPQPYFYRPNEGWQTRLALDATAARDYLRSEGLESDVNLRGFIFDPAPDFSALPETVVQDALNVIIPYPQQTSLATWTYEAASGRYLRNVLGAPSLDFDGNQIAASNVIIYFADHQETDIVEDSNGATSIRIQINGRGAAWLLRDGKILKGNWQTDGTVTPNFIFDDGRQMPLKPGNTWVAVVPLRYEINIDGTDQNSLGEASGAVDDRAVEGATQTETGETPPPTLTPIGARAATPTPAP